MALAASNAAPGQREMRGERGAATVGAPARSSASAAARSWEHDLLRMRLIGP